MPVVDVDPDELRRLTGTDRDDEELKSDLFALGLEFEGETDDGGFELEFAPDRLDRLSVEGIARSLRYQYGKDRGVVRPRDVHSAVVAVLVAKRARDALDRESVEAVGRELQLEVALLRLALEFESEGEQVVYQFVVSFLVVAGQVPKFVGIHVYDWH